MIEIPWIDAGDFIYELGRGSSAPRLSRAGYLHVDDRVQTPIPGAGPTWVRAVDSDRAGAKR